MMQGARRKKTLKWVVGGPLLIVMALGGYKVYATYQLLKKDWCRRQRGVGGGLTDIYVRDMEELARRVQAVRNRLAAGIASDDIGYEPTAAQVRQATGFPLRAESPYDLEIVYYGAQAKRGSPGRSGEGFIVVAVGNLDRDGKLDVWAYRPMPDATNEFGMSGRVVHFSDDCTDDPPPHDEGLEQALLQRLDVWEN